MTWLREALCAEVDPDLFHPTLSHPTASLAKTVCGQCRVRKECLSWAIKNPEMEGVLGGMSYRERRTMRQYKNLELA